MYHKSSALIKLVQSPKPHKALHKTGLKRTELFLNGVNRQRFAPELCLEKQHSRKKWEIEQDRFVFLFSGRIIPEKGVLELLHAFEKYMAI